jgi:hypothetical protein
MIFGLACAATAFSNNPDKRANSGYYGIRLSFYHYEEYILRLLKNI